MQPLPPDRFAILNRRGRRLSEAQVLDILQEGSPSNVPASQVPSSPPIAERAEGPVVSLEYRGHRQAPAETDPSALLPLPFRILGVAIWALVALAILFVMMLSI